LEVNNGTAGALADLNARDITASRNTAAGKLGLGDQSTGVVYFFYNGSYYLIPTMPVLVSNWLGVANTVAPVAPLDVLVAPTYRFGLTNSSGVGFLTMWNAAASAYQPMYFHAGGYVLPLIDNANYLGSSSNRWIAVYAVNGAIQTSDAREKTDIAPCDLGLGFIESLSPVSYKRIEGLNKVGRVVVGQEPVAEHYLEDGTLVPASTRPVYEDTETPIPGVRTHYGLIAQDVKKAVQDSGVRDFGGLVRGDIENLPLGDVDPDAVQGLNYAEFVAPLIKAVQELSARVRALEAQLGSGP
jgi:hypothetical protein